MEHLQIMNKLLSIILLLPSLAFGLEEPKYEMIGEYDGIEYREYVDYIVVETLVEGDLSRDEASNIGFRRLFRYITGENDGGAEISMTAPVQVAEPQGAEIAMTAPVQSVNTEQGWTISFVVPGKYTWDTVPQPTNPDVYLRQAAPGKITAVIRFSGRWTEKNALKARNELYKKLEEANVSPISKPIIAAYNSPFSIPWFRRNEILVEVDTAPLEYIL